MARPDDDPADPATRHRSVDGPVRDRDVLALAVPAFFALVAEPLFLLVDSAVVGRLGTAPLAGLGIASAVLSATVGLCVFLAYGTTGAVARRLGAGDLRSALAVGVDGLWLALALGAGLGAAGFFAAPALVGAFGPEADVAAQATTYLHWSLPGLPGMLVVLAATGVLRGLQDTRTPLVVATVGAVANAVLSVVLVLGLGFGIAGAAAGTSLTQLGMAAAVTAVVVRGARRHGSPLRPHLSGVLGSLRTGVPLLVRTLALRAALLLTTWAAARQGSAALAANQVATNVWSLLALALDALAIAAQALVGARLGAGDADAVRAAVRRMVRWGVLAGVVLGALLLLGRGAIPALFTTDDDVRTALVAALLVAAVTQPLAGYVFVLDGVLIGAGDGRYLAVAGVAQLALYVPVALVVARYAPGGAEGLVWLWIGFAGWFMATRALWLGLRARGTSWMVTGATR